MPTITIDRKVFDELVGKKLPDDKLKDRISMLGTDLEEVNSKEITVEIFPNRPDMLSAQGFARAFSSFIGVNKGLRKYNVKKSGYKVIMDKSLPKQWPYAFACIIKGLKFDDEKIKEVIQIQEKLGMTMMRKRKKGGIGLYPLEKIKFPVKFIGMKPEEIKFRPLEYPNSITGKQILSKHPTGREYGHLIEGWEKYPVFIDDNNRIMSMPPIINSHEVGKIDETTTEVFLEITGNDFNILQYGINIIVTALADIGGQIYSVECVMQNGKKIEIPNLKPSEMKIDINYCNKWLGLDLKENDLKKLLEKMGYGYNKKVLVPAYRPDVIHQVDLFEDIAIAYGYENFVPSIPNISTIGEEDKFEVFKKKIANILIGLGLIELNSYNLSNKENQCSKMKIDIDLIEVDNAVNIDYNVLRAWVIPSLLETYATNRHHEYPQNIFDIGTIFKKGNTDTGIVDNERLAVGICQENADYTKAKQVLDYLLRMLDVKYKIEEVDHDSFIKGRAARISVKGKNVAYIGEISPEVLSNWDLVVPVAAFELNLSELYEIL